MKLSEYIKYLQDYRERLGSDPDVVEQNHDDWTYSMVKYPHITHLTCINLLDENCDVVFRGGNFVVI